MGKYLLLLISAFAIAQTAPSRLPGLIITANQPTVTSTPNLTTTEANGLQGKISPVNLPLSNATATALETYTENSSGALSGFLLTDNGNGTVNIASGVALLRSTNSEIGVLSKYTIPAVTNLALTDNANNFVLVNYNAGTPSITVTTDPATINTTTNSLLYVVSRVGNVLNHVYTGEQNVDSNGKLRRRFLNIEPITRAQGAVISFANRNISVTAGLFYAGLTPYTTPLLGSAFTNVYNSASVWTRQTAQTLVNNTQYNVNGVLTTMNTGRFRVDYVYLLVNNPSQVYTVMGSAQYNNLAEARLAPLPSLLPVELQRLGVLVGRLIIEKDATAITEVSSAYDVRFNASTVINHNDTGGIQGGAVGDYQHVTTAEKTTWNAKQDALTNPVTGTGASGQVSFWTGTNTQAGENGLFWDATNKRLGVNTSAPTFMLSVDGANALASFRRNATPITSSPKFLFTRTGATLATDITAGMQLGAIQFRALTGGIESDYSALGYFANSTTIGDGVFKFLKSNLTSSVMDINSSNGRIILQDGGTFTDNGVDRLQITGSAISAAWKTSGGASTDYVTGTGSLINFNSGVRTATLTGFVSGAGTVSATDTVLQAIQKLNGNVNAAARPYKVYTATISQTGTSAPTITVLENTLGVTVTPSRSAVGSYVLTFSGTVTGNSYAEIHAFGVSSGQTPPTRYGISGGNTNITISSSLFNGGLLVFENTDSLLSGASIEVRYY